MAFDFRLPASSYEEIVKMIKAYGLSEKKSQEELSSISGVPRSNLSRNTNFFISIGIIDEKDRTATDLGKKLALSLDHGVESSITTNWKEIVQQSDFLTNMTTALRIRNGMDEESFRAHIAYSSGQKSSSYVKIGSATIIKILNIAGVIKDQNGKLYPVNQTGRISDNPKNTNLELSPNDVDKEEQSLEIRKVTKFRNNLTLNVNINIRNEDFPDIVDNIKNLIKELEDTEN